jgi:uncharacterized membrane protein
LFYTPGEGIAGMTVTATRVSDGASFSTTTFSSGGYSLRLTPGTYSVKASALGIAPVVYSNVVIGTDNVKRDFVPGVDTSPPAASNGSFLFQTPPMKLTMNFSESVAATLASSDLQLRKVGSNTLIPVTLASYDANNVATFTINGALSDGNYRATVPAGSVADAAGNLLPADYSIDFFVLTGDANHDRSVNGLDFNSLASNYGKSGMSFSQGDFNSDGSVNSLDFAALSSKFNASVAAVPLASPAQASPGDAFFTQRLISDVLDATDVAVI